MPPLAIRTEATGRCYLAGIDTTRDRPSEYSEALRSNRAAFARNSSSRAMLVDRDQHSSRVTKSTASMEAIRCDVRPDATVDATTAL